MGLASTRLADDADPDRATVVLHVDHDVPTGRRAGSGEIELGESTMLVASEVARRLACDGRLQAVLEGRAGPLGVGRTRRTVPRWLYRLVRRRDRGCRFPGCNQTRWLQAHHIVHWADGGPTDYDNIAMICTYHHRVVHELGWRVVATGAGGLEFQSPFGSVHTTGPPPVVVRPGVRRRLNRCFATAAAPLPLGSEPEPALADTG